jgi:imidazole glycerol phosphate synthase glutamine amidotransferase subunit
VTGPAVAVLDYGAGNLRSAQRALERAGAAVTVTEDAAVAGTADALVVPGVGHFGACVRRFVDAGLQRLVRGWVDDGRPLLGVCVGMQILYEHGEESPGTPGLGLLAGTVRRLPAGVRIPHMGWNTVEATRDDPILEGVAGRQCYFVHSYAADPSDDGHVVATADYGSGVAAVVRAGAVVGTQFHPEKSGDVGARLLANWLQEVRAACR